MSCNLDQSQISTDETTSFGYGGTTTVAQSFVPEQTGTICRVVVMLNKSGIPTDTVNAYICSDSSNTPGTQISDTQNLDLSTLSSSPAEITFNFSSGSLTAGNKYWFCIYRATDNGTHCPVISAETEDLYENGKVMKYYDSSWHDVLYISDIYFKQYTEYTPSASPSLSPSISSSLSSSISPSVSPSPSPNAGPPILASVFTETKDWSWENYNSNDFIVGQTFTSWSSVAQLYSAKFRLSKIGNPTGNLYAYIYAHTGTYGNGGKPGNGDSPLVTSDPIDISTLTTDEYGDWVTFNFTGANIIYLAASTHYCVAIRSNGGTVDDDNCYGVVLQYENAQHDGNYFDSGNAGITWYGQANIDILFYLYELAGSPSYSSSLSPSLSSSLSLSVSPSQSPSASISPSLSTSLSPSLSLSISPSISPSESPSTSISPSESPSLSVSTSLSPSESPSLSVSTSISPSISPTGSASSSLSPSLSPSLSLSLSPSISPSLSPSLSPSFSPSISPSKSPSLSPSISPSQSSSTSISPSISPSLSPSISPSLSPSISPSLSKSLSPSISPSLSPSISSSLSPSLSPSISRSLSPSLSPSISWSSSPSASLSPSLSPSPSPSLSPSESPSPSPSPQVRMHGRTKPHKHYGKTIINNLTGKTK
jgi:hypothetical protein